MTADEFRVGDSTKLSATRIAEYVADGLGRGLDGTYYEYDEGVWRRGEHAVRRRVAAALGDDFTSTVEKQVDAHLLNASIPQIGVREVKGSLPYIVVANGVYHFAVDDFMPHDERLGALTKLPIAYDARASCPRFETWLADVMDHDDDVIAHVWEIIGYVLMTGNPFQKAILFHGSGRNGKGTLLRVLRELLGEDNYSGLSLHTLVEDRFSAAGLFGKIANISGDLSDRFVKQPEVVKQITGGDAITTSHKYGQLFTFVPYAVPVFAANSYFRSSDTSHGWRRRWLVVDFQKQYPEGSFDETELFAEAAGIFNRAMDALRRLMARGSFAPPARAVQAAERLHDEDDPFVMWLEEDDCVQLRDDASTPKQDVYTRYRKWCGENGYQPMAHGPLGKRLAERGIRGSRRRDPQGKRAQSYDGIVIFLKTTD